MTLAQQKLEFAYKVGLLFGPLEELLKMSEAERRARQSAVVAQFCANRTVLMQEFAKFASQPGMNFEPEKLKFQRALTRVSDIVAHGQNVEVGLYSRRTDAMSAINSIPHEEISESVRGGNPFQAYCKLVEILKLEVRKEIIWLDPYFDDRLFYLYLAKVRQEAKITLVTEEPKSGKKDNDRFKAFTQVAMLFREERGLEYFELRISQSIHDRTLAIPDHKIYSLGGSVKDAARRDSFAISALLPSERNFSDVRDQVSASELWDETK
jgi:hypothetical protein